MDFKVRICDNKGNFLDFFVQLNRNGQLVFETRDWTRKWVGTLRGIQQASRVYVWMLEYNDATGKKISQKGTTALIR